MGVERTYNSNVEVFISSENEFNRSITQNVPLELPLFSNIKQPDAMFFFWIPTDSSPFSDFEEPFKNINSDTWKSLPKDSSDNLDEYIY